MTVGAVLICLAAAASAHAECLSAMPVLWSNENLERGPAAWTGNALVVAAFERDSNSIWISSYDEVGNPLLGPRRIVDSPQRSPLALLWTGEELGLFYVQANALTLQRLSTDGTLIGGPVPIVPGRRVNPGDEFDIVWSPALDAYFIGRTTTVSLPGIWVTLVEEDGSVRRDQRLFVQPHPRASVRVAVTDSGIGGVFYRSATTAEIVYMRVGPEMFTPAHPLGLEGEHLVLGTRDNNFVLFRSVPLDDGRTAIRWAEIDSSGNFVRPDSLLLTGSGVDVAPAAVHFRESEMALAYRDSLLGFGSFPASYMLRRMRHDGTVISDVPFAASDLGKVTFLSSHPFFWTASAYVQIVGRGHAQTLNTHLVRYCPLRAEIQAPRTARPGEAVTFTSAGSGGVAPHTLNWTFGDRTSARGKTVTHAYSETGTYRVTLRMTDSFGLVEETFLDITIYQPKRRATRK